MYMIGDLLADCGELRLWGRQGKLEPVKGKDRWSGTTGDEGTYCTDFSLPHLTL